MLLHMNMTMTALGLMSGTSMDGIDVAVIRTDGEHECRKLYGKTFPYNPDTQALIKACIGLRDENDPRIREAELAVTKEHALACQDALGKFPEIELIGFHGQTIWHAPEEGLTRQIGSGQLLSDMTKRKVVYDFRSNDMKHGGQGAPLMPLYHAAKARGLPRPIVIANIGGVSNITWIGKGENNILAFDTGPGNALLNDWMEWQTDIPMDKDGKASAKGRIDFDWIKEQMAHPYFKAKPPKALDRQDFTVKGLETKWSRDDGAATLSMFTATCLAAAAEYLPETPAMWVITGGGRHNPVIMKNIKSLIKNSEVVTAEAAAWNGDSLEAEGFAYLAVRSVNKMPLSFPKTTGCTEPVTGGVIVTPRS